MKEEHFEEKKFNLSQDKAMPVPPINQPPFYFMEIEHGRFDCNMHLNTLCSVCICTISCYLAYYIEWTEGLVWCP